MFKWHPVMYTNTPQVNPITEILKQLFTCSAYDNTKDNAEYNVPSVNSASSIIACKLLGLKYYDLTDNSGDNS